MDPSDFPTRMPEQPTVVGASAASKPAKAPPPENLGAIFQPGALIAARYEIEQMLGLGGMGAVYKARDTMLDRVVALKVIRPDLASDPQVLQRFKQEIILARQITHRNVVRVFDIGEADGVMFITMEFIEGVDLRSIVSDKGKLTPQEAVEIMWQVCCGLDAAHKEGVVHRDLKPGNIMRDATGRVVVMDFGLATSLQSRGMTQTGAMLGTMEYMSPEQAKGAHTDARSDIFTTGLILYELLTGKMPYQADSAITSLVMRTQTNAKPPSEIDASIPKPLSEIVSRCLERDLAKRFQSSSELVGLLDGFREHPSSMASAQNYVAAVSLRRWKLISLVGSASVLLVLAIVGGYFVARSKPKTAAVHAPVSVLVGDFNNLTGDPIFDGTLEPMMNVALEGASFINAYNRGSARKLAQKLPHPTDKLDEQSARLVAVSQGISAVVRGELSLRGNGYSVSAMALDAVSGKVLAESTVTAPDKDSVLQAIPKLAATIRKALGDTTPESVQLLAAQGTFAASSLEAVHEYGRAMEFQFAGKMQDALNAFSKAAELDPNFARAYSGMAAAYGNMGRPADAEKYAKLAMEHIDHLSERERYRTRGTYYLNTANWQKCVEEYNELANKFPGDNIAHTNLANCYSQLRNWPKAVEEARKDVTIHPNAAGLGNLALFSAYAGDFQGGAQEALKLQKMIPTFEYGYLAQAFAQVGEGKLQDARDTYQKISKMSPLGASMASAGIADMDLYEGSYSEAVRILESGVTADLAAKLQDRAADKYLALAYAQLLRGKPQDGVPFAEKALALSQSVKTRFIAALTYVEAGQNDKAEKLAASLGAEIQPEPQVYAKIITGQIALKKGNGTEAIQSFSDANALLDTWIGHFSLGTAYLQTGSFVEADSEFDTCVKRRGETLALFLDEVPTNAFFPAVYYYEGRAREGMKSSGAAEMYQAYLAIRGKSTEDPLVQDIHKRLGR